MKKLIALVLALAMAACLFAGCTAKKVEEPAPTAEPVKEEPVKEEPKVEEPKTEEPAPVEEVTGMSYAEFMAAPIDSEVEVVTYVQANQSWWDNKMTVYTQNEEGGYFLYEVPCDEELANQLIAGTKIKVTGFKSEWAGEVEITDAKVEILDGAPYYAEAIDLTDMLGNDGIAEYANRIVSFKDMTVTKVEFKNGEPGDDIYVTLAKDGVEYDFCLEYYLNGSDEEFYSQVMSLLPGDILDVEGFLYFYNGINPHMLAVNLKGSVNTKSEGVMTGEEYLAAAVDAPVTVECYVQGHQSWWNNMITVYAADAGTGYFMYEMACSEEDAAKLVPGTKIKVTGFKAEWGGEVEIVDAKFEFVDDGISFIAPVKDATALLGTDDLATLMNQAVSFTDMTVKSIEYKNGQPGDDIYVTLTKDGADYAFCLEYYLNGSDADFYALVGGLTEGQVCDVEGFLYWYNGMNPHITKVTVK